MLDYRKQLDPALSKKDTSLWSTNTTRILPTSRKNYTVGIAINRPIASSKKTEGIRLGSSVELCRFAVDCVCCLFYAICALMFR